jgi:hypothetical protein
VRAVKDEARQGEHVNIKTRFKAALAGLSVTFLLGAPAMAQTVQINGAGATFPFPIYSKWFDEYNKLHPDVEINYQSIGSGGGIRQVSNETVFFGASDGPMTDEQLAGGARRRSSTSDGPRRDVPVYNIPGVSAELKFTGPVLADIFLGKITKWNDPAIAKLNPGVSLPGNGHHRRASLGRLGHDLHLGGLSLEGLSGVEEAGRRRDVGQLARRCRRQGERRRVRPRDADPGRHRLRRADLRDPEQDQRTGRCRTWRANSCGLARLGDRGGGWERPGPCQSRLPRFDHERARQRACIPSASFTWLLFYENPKDKKQAKIMVEFVKLGPDGRTEVLRRSRLRSAAEGSRCPRDGSAQEDQTLDPRPRGSRDAEEPAPATKR